MLNQVQTISFADAVRINPRVNLDRGGTYPYVGMADVYAETRSVTARECRTYKGNGSRFRVGDTLMARITPCLENGKIARYSGVGAAVVGFGSTEFIVIRGREGFTYDGYAHYLARSPEFREYAINSMTGTSGRQRVPVQALSDFVVNLPPLAEQRRIAHILGTLDDKIELNRRMNETLEEMARAVFKDWFVDFGPVCAKMEGREAYLPEEIWRLFPDRLVDSELGEIPEGWEVKALDEIANYRNGLALQKFRPGPDEDRLPVVKIAQLRSGVPDSGEWSSATITPECVIDNGDVVFSWSGSLLVKVWTGGRAALNQHLFKVTSEVCPKWFYLHFTKYHLAEFQSIAADKTTTMGHIKRQHLRDAKCAVPPPDVLEAVNNRLESLLEQSISNDVSSRRIANLRDALLPMLVSGALFNSINRLGELPKD